MNMSIAIALNLPVGNGSLDDNETSAAGEALQALIGSPGFLDHGRANGGVWFEIPESAKALIRENADGGPAAGNAIINALEQMMAQVNAFLSRSDVSDALKMKYLARMFGTATDTYDDTEDLEASEMWTLLGTVVAECMVGNPDTIKEMFDTGLQEAISLRDVTSMISSFSKVSDEFLNDNKVSPEPDKSMAYLGSLSLLAEAEAKRRKGMSAGDLIADIRASRAQVQADIEKRKQANAESSETPAYSAGAAYSADPALGG
jgi:hypothetical protein